MTQSPTVPTGPGPVMMLEFNELVPALMDEFIEDGSLPNFGRMRRESWIGLTDPEEPQETLEPWIQWVTVHTGQAFADHGLRNLGEDHRLEAATVGEAVAAAGRPTLIFGSMNVPHRVHDSVHVPDPWTVEGRAQPRALQSVFTLVRSMVQEKDSVGFRPSAAASASAASALLRRGVRPTTVRAALRQLADERRGVRGRWGRALVLDAISWDLFRWYHRRTQPAFSTFFSNSTAHFQHHHWRDHAPELFSGGPNPTAGAADAVRSGYVAMDRMVGQALEMVGDAGSIVFCTGLSQQPYVSHDETGGKTLYHPISREGLLKALGIAGISQVTPVMSEVFHVRFVDDASVDAGEAVLRSVKLDGDLAFGVTRDSDGLQVSCVRHTPAAPGAVLVGGAGGAVRFHDHFVAAATAKSGYHHANGMLWFHGAGIDPATIDSPVSLRSVAPTILALLGITPPASMTEPPIPLVPPAGSDDAGARSR